MDKRYKPTLDNIMKVINIFHVFRIRKMQIKTTITTKTHPPE